MKPPTIQELRQMAESFCAMNDNENSSDYRHDRLCAMALERWADQLERKELPSAQVLIFQPELTHSVWVDVMHRKRSRTSLEAMLRQRVRSGEYVGYRLIGKIEAEHIGITWTRAVIDSNKGTT